MRQTGGPQVQPCVPVADRHTTAPGIEQAFQILLDREEALAWAQPGSARPALPRRSLPLLSRPQVPACRPAGDDVDPVREIFEGVALQASAQDLDRAVALEVDRARNSEHPGGVAAAGIRAVTPIQADERFLGRAPAPSGLRGQIVDQPDRCKPASCGIHEGRGRQTPALDIAGELPCPSYRMGSEAPGREVDVEVQVEGIQRSQLLVPAGAMKSVQRDVGISAQTALGHPGHLTGSVDSAMHTFAGYGRHDRRLSDRGDRMQQPHVVCRGQLLRNRLSVEEMSGVQMFHAGELGSRHGLQKYLKRRGAGERCCILNY